MLDIYPASIKKSFLFDKFAISIKIFVVSNYQQGFCFLGHSVRLAFRRVYKFLQGGYWINWLVLSFPSSNTNKYLNRFHITVSKINKGGKMGKVISKTGIKREKGFLYFLNKKGDVAKVAMKRAGKKQTKNR